MVIIRQISQKGSCSDCAQVRWTESGNGKMKPNTRKTLLMAMLPFLLLSVGGCGGGSRKNAPDAAPSPGCDGSCASASTFLSVADVERILAQGITEAQARGVAATPSSRGPIPARATGTSTRARWPTPRSGSKLPGARRGMAPRSPSRDLLPSAPRHPPQPASPSVPAAPRAPSRCRGSKTARATTGSRSGTSSGERW